MNQWNRRKFIALMGGMTAVVAFSSCQKTPGTPEESDGKLGKSSETQEESYRKLEEFLAARKWQAADMKTLELMLKITNREQEGYLIEEGRTFPCTDLQTINDLWLKYSDGRFGFSVQEKIWESMGFQPGYYNEPGAYNYQNFLQLAERVGWRSNGQWIPYKNLNFSISAPEGHLPVRVMAEDWDISIRNPTRRFFASMEVLWTDLTARIVRCNIN